MPIETRPTVTVHFAQPRRSRLSKLIRACNDVQGSPASPAFLAFLAMWLRRANLSTCASDGLG